jgi:hypothetical protein
VLPVPKSSLQVLEWRSKPSAIPDSDGILVLTRSNGEIQPSVMMFNANRLISGVPVRWQSISFR